MEFSELRRLVDQGEGLKLEFKRKLPEPEKLVKEAIAFANTEGGILLIGVEDDGEIYGLKDPDEAEEAFALAVKKFCQPELQYQKERIALGSKRSVVAFHIPPSRNKPHQLMGKGEEKGITYVRYRDESIRASREVFHLLRHEGKNRDIKIEYGPKEEILMKYLADHQEITLKEFAGLAGISSYTASRTLVHLVRGNVLKIRSTPERDYFSPVIEK